MERFRKGGHLYPLTDRVLYYDYTIGDTWHTVAMPVNGRFINLKVRAMSLRMFGANVQGIWRVRMKTTAQ